MLGIILIIAIIGTILNVLFGLPMEFYMLILGVLLSAVLVFTSVESNKNKETLKKLKSKMRENNKLFEPTKTIELNIGSTDIAIDFLVNDKKEKFAISYTDRLGLYKQLKNEYFSQKSERSEQKYFNEEIKEKLKNLEKDDTKFAITKFIEYNFSDLIDFELLESTETKLQSKMLATAGGALLFGSVGALIGMSGERKSKKEKEFIIVNLQLNDINCPVFPIEFFNCNTDLKDNYEKHLASAKELCSILTYIIHNSQKEIISSKDGVDEESVFNKIEKLVELKEKNIITEEEFTISKTNLLNKLK